MRVNKILVTSLVLWAGITVANAGDLRIWTDHTGTTVEAEHVRTLDDKVVLKKADGTEFRVSLDTLSERDRKYAILQSPPRITISVSPKTSRSNTGYNRGVQVTDETVTVNATVKKSSSAPYEAPLQGELYLIGSRSKDDGFIILDKTTARFKFSADNGNSHAFSSSAVSLQQVQMGATMGVQYAGYLIVVRDKTDDLLQVKCSKMEFEKNTAAILRGTKGTVFDKNFKEIDKKDKPDNRKGIPKNRKLAPGKRY